MKYRTFDLLQSRIQELYRTGDYHAAFELATEQTSNFPKHFPFLLYWRVCLAARIGEEKLAEKLLEQAIQDGFWYNEVLLRRNPSLTNLQGKPEFEKHVEMNRLLQDSDQKYIYPILTLRAEGRCQAGSDPCPLLLALHANASTAQASINFWRIAASNGWLVAIPQSTQAMWKDAYVWDDLEISEAELKKHYTTICQQYATDPRSVIVAGHSIGGELAMRLALGGVIPAQGFIAIGPSGPLLADVENWKDFLREKELPPLRGYFIIGGEDTTTSRDNIRSLVKLLNQLAIETSIEEVPNADHDFSEDYEASLLRGLAFISEKQ